MPVKSYGSPIPTDYTAKKKTSDAVAVGTHSAIDVSGGAAMSQAEYYARLNVLKSTAPVSSSAVGSQLRTGVGPLIAAAAIPGLADSLAKAGTSPSSPVVTDLKSPIVGLSLKATFKETSPNTGITGTHVSSVNPDGTPKEVSSGAAGSAWAAGSNSFIQSSTSGIPNVALLIGGALILLFILRR